MPKRYHLGTSSSATPSRYLVASVMLLRCVGLRSAPFLVAASASLPHPTRKGAARKGQPPPAAWSPTGEASCPASFHSLAGRVAAPPEAHRPPRSFPSLTSRASSSKVPPSLGKMAKTEAELKALWAEAYDAWKSVPGHQGDTLYLMPEPPGASGQSFPEIPEVIHGMVLFGLTSWNPMGQDAPLADNLESYKAIEADLHALSPRHMWQSFGFDASGYRENGFTVAFPVEDAAAARQSVVAVAKKFGQGAVYEFRAMPPGSGRVVRSTVAALVEGVDADVTMVVCPRPALPAADPTLHFGG